MFQLVIIADDLTGAMDTGVQFAKRGLRTIVSLSDTLDHEVARGADVAVLNTNSRPDEPAEAHRKLLACGRYVRELGVERVYKKIDSTLRGNVGSELDALMEALGVETVLLTPAFPAVGRTVIGGLLMINGVPWEKTQYAGDGSVGTSFIPHVIGSRQRAATVELADIERGLSHLVECLRDMAAAGVGVIVADAMGVDHLAVVAKAAVVAGLDSLMCGSGGLAEELPCALGLAGSGYQKPVAAAEDRPVLVVAGTVNRVTIEQVRNAQKAMAARLLEVLPAALRRDPEVQRARVQAACEAAVLEKQDLIVASVPLTVNIGATMVARDAAVATTLGPVVATALRPGDWAGMLMTGGDTAVALCQALGVGALEIEGEVEPGVPCGRLLEGPLAGLRVVTKAGGFGSPETIAKAIAFLRGRTL